MSLTSVATRQSLGDGLLTDILAYSFNEVPRARWPVHAHAFEPAFAALLRALHSSLTRGATFSTINLQSVPMHWAPYSLIL